MKIIVREFTNNGIRTGAVITALPDKYITIDEKKVIEQQLQNYALTKVFPGALYSMYTNTESDTPEVVILLDMNKLTYIEDSI